jgi:thymidylate synthase (FAD)
MTECIDHVAVLDKGFVRIRASMGDDESIVNAARISYGEGTRQVSQDKALIRYLIRNQHWSPVEQVQIQFHVKCPIFVARQLFRHRTMSINEMSARYSIMQDEFYLPEMEVIQPQSEANKQGRAGEIDQTSKRGVLWLIRTAYEQAYAAYDVLLGKRDNAADHFDPYSADSPLLSDDYPGTSRELARIILPVGLYTEFVFSINLRNLFHLLKLRMDAHAQYEIREFANAMFALVQPRFPLACEAANDYLFEAHTLSRMDITAVRDVIAHPTGFAGLELDYGGEKNLADHYAMSLRELRELRVKLTPVP